MDLSYNLGADPSLFLGTDPDRIKEYVGGSRISTYIDALQTAKENNVSFSLFPADNYSVLQGTCRGDVQKVSNAPRH
jgi:hypothetical protein